MLLAITSTKYKKLTLCPNRHSFPQWHPDENRGLLKSVRLPRHVTITQELARGIHTTHFGHIVQSWFLALKSSIPLCRHSSPWPCYLFTVSALCFFLTFGWLEPHNMDVSGWLLSLRSMGFSLLVFWWPHGSFLPGYFWHALVWMHHSFFTHSSVINMSIAPRFWKLWIRPLWPPVGRFSVFLVSTKGFNS